jgi:nucleoside phosphorylase
MSRILVFAASDMEAQSVRKIAGPNELVLVISGMGPGNARSKAEAVLGSGEKPDAIVVVGLSGGLTPSVAEGTIVAYTECRASEPGKPSLRCSKTVTDTLMTALMAANIRCEWVVGITSARIATTREERHNLSKSGAAVVDMETYPIVSVAEEFGIPVVVLRVVSDSIDRELPDFNRALNEAGGLDGRKALKVALGSPLKTVKLLAANKRAMQRLAPALEVVLTAQL